MVLRSDTVGFLTILPDGVAIACSTTDERTFLVIGIIPQCLHINKLLVMCELYWTIYTCGARWYKPLPTYESADNYSALVSQQWVDRHF